MNDGYFDAEIARTYDARHQSDPLELEHSARLLKALAGDGDALEFAIGTGRVALPLASLGVSVSGIELSRSMVDVLRSKEGGAQIDVTIGDMTTARVKGVFSLVYLVYNTIDNLVTQEAQVACFQNASAHLAPGGRFLIETLVPPIQKIPFGENKLAFDRSEGHWGIDEFDLVSQNYASHHAWIEGDRPLVGHVPFRYAWPAEMDLMARLAGMSLEYRWSDWQKSSFEATSKSHISVWRKPL